MNLPARNGVFLAGDALRTGELAVEAVLLGPGGEETYGTTVRELYRQRARTNEWLRRAMYRERAARVIVPIIQHAPRLARWLADNILGGEHWFR